MEGERVTGRKARGLHPWFSNKLSGGSYQPRDMGEVPISLGIGGRVLPAHGWGGGPTSSGAGVHGLQHARLLCPPLSPAHLRVRRVGDAVQPSHPLSPPSPVASVFPNISVFPPLRLPWLFFRAKTSLLYFYFSAYCSALPPVTWIPSRALPEREAGWGLAGQEEAQRRRGAMCPGSSSRETLLTT